MHPRIVDDRSRRALASWDDEHRDGRESSNLPNHPSQEQLAHQGTPTRADDDQAGVLGGGGVDDDPSHLAWATYGLDASRSYPFRYQGSDDAVQDAFRGFPPLIERRIRAE